MAITHVNSSTVSCEESLFRIYNFVANSGQTAVEFVGAGGTPAIYKQGTGYVASFTSASDCPDESYIVITPVSSSLTKWQCRIKNSAANTLKVTFAPDGTWSNGGAGPGSFSGIATPEQTWNDSGAPGAGSTIDVCAGTISLPTSKTGTFFWVNIRDSGSSVPDQFFYAGAYEPARIGYDTKPCILLTRVPLISNNSFELGSSAQNSNTLSRCATDVAHVSTWDTGGYCRIGIGDANGARVGNTTTWRDLGGYYIAPDAWIFLNNTLDKRCMGRMGDHFKLMDISTAYYDSDSNHLRVGDLWLQTADA